MSENSDNLDRIGKAMMAAWGRVKKAQTRMWGEWMTIGEGLLEGRNWAMRQAGVNKPEGKGYVMAYAEWLKRYRVDDMDKSDRAKLLQIMEERPGVEEWRATLTDWERRNLNNPVVVWRKWTAATRVKKPKKRTDNVSGSEHGRAQDMVQQLQARVSELEEELTSTREVQLPGTLLAAIDHVLHLAALETAWPQLSVNNIRKRKDHLDVIRSRLAHLRDLAESKKGKSKQEQEATEDAALREVEAELNAALLR
jgi:hypothetical protein